MKFALMMAVAAGASAAFLASCATTPVMSASHCAVADWQSVGLQDGVAGNGPDRFVKRAEACVAAGVLPNHAAYEQGRREGLAQYCQPENGFRLAMEGRNRYGGHCPAELDAAFRAGLTEGSRVYQTLSALRKAESVIASAQSRRAALDNKINANENGLILAASDAERQRHRNELIALRQQRAQIDSDVRVAETELRWRNGELARLRVDVAPRWNASF
jgi:hypothetical protein